MLTSHGTKHNLFFFLGGAGGSGKIHAIDTDSINLTELTKTAAALLGRWTVHAVAELNKSI
eukprot:2720781-Ditylum_brightwellii.AAC.1